MKDIFRCVDCKFAHYGTKEHYEALRRLGPCPQHRLTFRGVCKDCTVEQEQGCLL